MHRGRHPLKPGCVASSASAWMHLAHSPVQQAATPPRSRGSHSLAAGKHDALAQHGGAPCNRQEKVRNILSPRAGTGAAATVLRCG